MIPMMVRWIFVRLASKEREQGSTAWDQRQTRGTVRGPSFADFGRVGSWTIAEVTRVPLGDRCMTLVTYLMTSRRVIALGMSSCHRASKDTDVMHLA